MSATEPCGCPTTVEGKFRSCEHPKGHEGDHETTYCGKDFRWSNDTMTTPTKGAMSAAKEIYATDIIDAKGIAAIIDAHTHAVELEVFVRDCSEWRGDAQTLSINQEIIAGIGEKARVLRAKLEGGK